MISHSRVRQIFTYDEDAGILYRNGRPAGYNKPNGYVGITVDTHQLLLHRLIWFYVHGNWPSEEIDHIDRNPRNNRISNLREINRRGNAANRSVQSNNKVQVKNIHFDTKAGSWRVQIKRNDKRHRSWHSTLEQAIITRDLVIQELTNTSGNI